MTFTQEGVQECHVIILFTSYDWWLFPKVYKSVMQLYFLLHTIDDISQDGVQACHGIVYFTPYDWLHFLKNGLQDNHVINHWRLACFDFTISMVFNTIQLGILGSYSYIPI